MNSATASAIPPPGTPAAEGFVGRIPRDDLASQQSGGSVTGQCLSLSTIRYSRREGVLTWSFCSAAGDGGLPR
jgi:hypothetical protein